MLQSRRSRVLFLAAIAVSIAGGLLLPQFRPDRFYKATNFGLVMSGSQARSTMDVWRAHNYSKDVYDRAQAQCVNFGEDSTRPLETEADMVMLDMGFDRKVVCETGSDRIHNIIARLLAFLIGPVLIFVLFGVYRWVQSGGSKNDV